MIGNRYVKIHHTGFGRMVGVRIKTPTKVARKLKTIPAGLRFGISKTPIGCRAS
jgi:hypothetical protein